MRNKPDNRPRGIVNGKTLEDVVRDYLAELENPATDVTMREVYRRWMAEFVGVEFRADR